MQTCHEWLKSCTVGDAEVGVVSRFNKHENTWLVTRFSMAQYELVMAR